MDRGSRSTIVCCALGCVSLNASAAEWSAQPVVAFGVDADSNRRLKAEGASSRAGRLTGSLDLARATERHELSLRPRFAARRYDGAEEVLDSNDYGADLRFERKGEYSRFTSGANFSEDSTLLTELADTGFVEGRARRRSRSAYADLSRSIGVRSRLQVGASVIDVDFDRAAGTGLTPYRYPALNAGYALDVSEQSELRVVSSAGRLDIPSNGARTDNLGLRLSWRGSLSERFGVEFAGGVERTETAFAQDQGAVFELKGKWNGERSDFGLDLSRGVEPSAHGTMVRSDSASGSWRWQASPRATFSMVARHARREDLLFGLFRRQREYSALDLAFSWRLDETWLMELRGGARRQEFDLIESQAEGAHAGLSISWSPRHYAMSR
jgi:hypothetical protein